MLRGVWRRGEFALDIAGAVDAASEKERLGKEADRIQGQMEKIAAKLQSESFLSRAPEQIVSENRLRYQELSERYRKITANLSRLPSE
jgi:valyl-tRNA synthetase